METEILWRPGHEGTALNSLAEEKDPRCLVEFPKEQRLHKGGVMGAQCFKTDGRSPGITRKATLMTVIENPHDRLGRNLYLGER